MMGTSRTGQPDIFDRHAVRVWEDQDVCVRGDASVCVQKNSGSGFPLKERVRGSASVGAFEAKQMRYAEQLQKVRAEAVRLRDSFDRAPYRKGTRQLKLHFWQRSSKQGDEFALRWRWSWKQTGATREQTVYVILPLNEVLADPQNVQHQFVHDFLREIRGTPLFTKMMEFEFARVSINVSLRQARSGKANNVMLAEAALFQERMLSGAWDNSHSGGLEQVGKGIAAPSATQAGQEK